MGAGHSKSQFWISSFFIDLLEVRRWARSRPDLPARRMCAAEPILQDTKPHTALCHWHFLPRCVGYGVESHLSNQTEEP